MDILIVTGVLLMLAAVAVMYYEWRVERTKRIGAEADNAALRNDLHAAINARKAKSRGITGTYRKAIEAHQACCVSEVNAGTQNDRALWSVLEGEAV